MERTQVMYVTEEEKLAILRNRLEAERKANRRRLTTKEKHHRAIGWFMLGMALACLYIGGEAIIGTIMCGFFALVGFTAREEVREEWVEL